ncbi:MAG TPA: PolC-type DNA polymerase III, partial [Symbiobacteriaceae bacterium]|nr:PolC-type DNA polymerase III [Symbiobacteriaceae bacterium]
MSPQTDWLALIDRTSLPADLVALLEETTLQYVEVRQRAQEVTLHLNLPRRLPLAHRETLAQRVAAGCFPGMNVSIQLVPQVAVPPADPAGALADAWDEISLQARTALPRLNGILDKAVWALEGNVVRVEVPTDTMIALVESCGGVQKLESLVRQETGLNASVRLVAKPKPKLEVVKARVDEIPEDPFADAPAEEVPLPPEPAFVDPAAEFMQEYVTDWMQRQSAFGKKEAKAGGGGALPTDGPLRG